jgi:hypothetical protein
MSYMHNFALFMAYDLMVYVYLKTQLKAGATRQHLFALSIGPRKC